MPDPRKFLYNSDYPNDYIVLALTRNYTVNGASANPSSLAVIPHGLPFAPLVDGVWGFSSDLSDARSIADTHGPNLTSMAALIIEVSSDETNIYIYCDNYEWPYTTRTFYFKLWAFMNPAFMANINPVDDNTKYKFNSDFNYLKLAMADNMSIAANTTGTVNHSLGFKPRVLAWLRMDYGFTSNNTFQIVNAQITESRLSILNNNYSAKQASYRIYANE